MLRCCVRHLQAPLKNALSAFLKDHPNCEVYTGQEKSCVKSNIDVQLPSEMAKSDASTWQEADGSSPRTPATRVSGGAHCSVPTRADFVKLQQHSIQDDMTPMLKIAGGACRHRNKSGHLVDLPLKQAGCSEEIFEQMSQDEGDELEHDSESDKPAAEGEELVPSHTQEVPMEAAITKQSRRPKISRPTNAPTVPTPCATRSSATATLQNGGPTIEKQLGNRVVHASLKNQKYNQEKTKGFPSGGALQAMLQAPS